LAMFVDAGYAHLLTALAAGNLYVTPAIIDPNVTPPFDSQPPAEFARGTFYFQERQGHPLSAVRFYRRTAFYLDVNRAWKPVVLSIEDLNQQEVLSSPGTWHEAQAKNPSHRIAKIGRGEAECATVAVSRGWTLWSDDAAIVHLLAALHPGHPVERISHLVMRAAREGLLSCQEAADLYNDAFKATLGLWTSLTLICEHGQVVIRQERRA
jgi:hypothetical protein